MLQTPVAVKTSSCCANADKSQWSPENTIEITSPSSTTENICNSSALSIDSGKSPELGRVPAGDFTVAPSVLLGEAVPNSLLVTKSCTEVIPSIAAGQTECHISPTGSLDQQYSSSSFQTYVQGSCSFVTSPTASSLSLFPASALHRSSRLPFADREPFAVNWDVKNPSAIALDSFRTSLHTMAELFPDRKASQFPAFAHSSCSEIGRHRSVKAGSTWFPTELQKSLDCGSAKKRTVESSSSARVCSSNVLNSPLKQFVNRHRTRMPAQNRSHSSEGVGFHRNGVSTARHAVEPVADQPVDLSIQRRNVEPKSSHNPPLNRTNMDSIASDEPLDLSQSASSVRSDTRTPRHPSHSSRSSDSGSKLPSGVIDLQNYCSLLLSGGYSLDSPLSAIASSSSFPSLVSKVCPARIL